MNKRTSRCLKATLALLVSCIVASAFWRLSESASMAQSAVPELPPGVQDAIKLSKAGMSEDLILAQIKNGGTSYNLNADQIIYLKSQGLSQNVITALLTLADNDQAASAGTAQPPAAT